MHIKCGITFNTTMPMVPEKIKIEKMKKKKTKTKITEEKIDFFYE